MGIKRPKFDKGWGDSEFKEAFSRRPSAPVAFRQGGMGLRRLPLPYLIHLSANGPSYIPDPGQSGKSSVEAIPPMLPQAASAIVASLSLDPAYLPGLLLVPVTSGDPASFPLQAIWEGAE